jgi:hypothetical protein
VRLDVNIDLDPGEAVGELVKGDDAGVSHTLRDVPLDALVRPLLDDLGLEAPVDSPDLRREGDGRLIYLLHTL